MPKVVTNPVWSLQPWPLVVTLPNGEAEIPAVPASQWLAILMAEVPELEDIFTVLAPELAELVDDALMDELLSFQDHAELMLSVLDQVCGRPWYVALRLVACARNSWDVIGPEMMRVINPADVSLSAWLDMALIVILKSMDQKDTTMFTLKLESPPPGHEEEVTMSADDFGSLMNG